MNQNDNIEPQDETPEIVNDQATIRRTLETFSIHTPSVEIRRLKPVSQSLIIKLNDQGITSGVNFIMKYPKETAYFTFNRLDGVENEFKAVTDAQITSYEFLFVDVDAKHPKGLSANDKELEEAKAVADTVNQYLLSMGMTSPIFSCSGNGYHLFYPIESISVVKGKPIIKGILTGLYNVFCKGKTQATVDVVVSNPARIAKIPGSVSKKGQSTLERPHRVSYFLETGDMSKKASNDVVERTYLDLQEQQAKSTQEVLEESDGHANIVQSNPKVNKKPIIIDDFDDWLRRHADFKVISKKDEETRIVYPMSNCPIREHHENQSGSSFIWDKKTHQVIFNCLHASCHGKTINDVFSKYRIKIPKLVINPASFSELVTQKFHSFELKGNGVYYDDEKHGHYWICSPVLIESIYKNDLTDEVNYEIALFSVGKWKKRVFPASVLNTRNLKELLNFGFDFLPRCEEKVISYLQLQKRNAKIKNVHTKIGWHDEIFYLDQAYPLDSAQNRGVSKHLSETNEYKIQGSFEAWRAVIEHDVLGTNLELGLALSFTSNIVGYLKMKGLAVIDCPVISFSGRSSSGKTTMEYLIAGVYGQPNELVETLNMTDNALIQSLASNHGVPLIFDELGVVSDKDLSALIYQISTGKGRKRLNSNADLVAASQFSTTAIFSSEQPLSNYLNSSLGLRARVIAFDGISWTKSASASQNVKAASQLNSGQAIDQFMKKMVSDTQVDILSMIKRNEEKLKPQMMHHAIKERVCQQLALILTSGELVKRYLDISIDVTNLIELLLQSYTYAIDDASESSEEEIASRLSSLLVANRHKFGYQKYTESWGIIQEKLDSSQYVVNKSVFLKLFSRNFEKVNLKQQLNYMKAKGLLLTEKDRLTKRMTVDNQNITCYVFKLPKVTHDVIEQFELQVVHPKPITFRDNDELFKSIDQSNELTDADFNDTETGGEK